MKRRLLPMPAGAALGFAFALMSCVTINVYFPAAAIKDLSRQIEDEVARKAEEAPAQQGGEMPAAKPGDKPAGKPEDAPSGKPADALSESRSSSSGMNPARESSAPMSAGLLDALLGVTPAYAQSGEVAAPEVSSPAIRRIIESRATRVAPLNQYKTKGVIGESNQALVEIRSLEGLADLKARAEAQRLVKAENVDREELFKEVAAAKNVELSQLAKIRETYAATLRENARAGDWIQDPDGKWRRK